MDRFVARANIDHYLSVLNSINLSTANRTTIVKLLMAEMDKLALDLEQLEFAEGRAAKCWGRVSHFRKLRDSLVDGSSEHAQADKLLALAEETHKLMDQFCHQLREKVSRRM